MKDLYEFEQYYSLAKLKLPIILSFFAFPVLQIFEKYVFSDWQFLVFLIILIMLDTLTGVWKHWKRKTISSQGFSGFITKVIVYGIFLIVVHIATTFSDIELANDIFGYLEDLAFSALVARECISIVENLGEIKPGLIPSWILKKLKSFDETGNII